jgi:hypothetical protein
MNLATTATHHKPNPYDTACRRKRPLEEPDAVLVAEVRAYMKANKLSQVMVGQEARVSQAVISQWLSLKYHGHNAKVACCIACAINGGFSMILCPCVCARPRSIRRCANGCPRAGQVAFVSQTQMNLLQCFAHPAQPLSAKSA